MTAVLWGALVLLAGSCGVLLGAILGANARAEIEDENATLKRRLLSRYEEHA